MACSVSSSARSIDEVKKKLSHRTTRNTKAFDQPFVFGLFQTSEVLVVIEACF